VGKAAENFTDEADEELTRLVTTMASSNSNSNKMNVKQFHDCDVSFHRRIWSLAGNEFLRHTLETITFRLFVFSVVGRWSNNPRALDESLASVQQHLGILQGLRTRDKNLARQAFIRHTVQYWNAQYQLGLSETELSEVYMSV
jgi:DNA-binding FadR family transcriptional regulator